MNGSAKEQIESYMTSKEIQQLFESLTTALVFQRPADHFAFLIECLRKVKEKEASNERVTWDSFVEGQKYHGALPSIKTLASSEHKEDTTLKSPLPPISTATPVLSNVPVILVMGSPWKDGSTLWNDIMKHLERKSKMFFQFSLIEVIRQKMVNGDNARQDWKELADSVERGDTIPDDVMYSLLSEFIHAKAVIHGLLIHGYPRTMHQVKQFEKIFPRCDLVIVLDCDEETFHQRLTREIAKSEESDDTSSTVTSRMEFFISQTLPVMNYLDKKEKVVHFQPSWMAMGNVLDDLKDVVESVSNHECHVHKNVGSPPPTALSVQKAVSAIISKDSSTQLEGLQCARKLLSSNLQDINISSIIDDFIAAGVLPRLLLFLDNDNSTIVQTEASWVLTNIASGDSNQTHAVVKAGAIPKLVALLASSDAKVRDGCVWTLANIAGDGTLLRDKVLDAGAMEPLLAMAQSETELTLLRNIVWALCNLWRHKNTPPPYEACCRCLPTFSKLLYHDDREVVKDTCWALSYITSGGEEWVQAVVNQSGLLAKLAEILYHEDPFVVHPALKAIGDIISSENEWMTQAVVDIPRAMQALPILLTHSRMNMRKDAAWVVSNIAAGSESQIQAVIDYNMLPAVIELMANGNHEAQNEAVHVISNLADGGNLEQVTHMVDQGALKSLLDIMVCSTPHVVMLALRAVQSILRAADEKKKENPIYLKLEELVGEEILLALKDSGDLKMRTSLLIPKIRSRYCLTNEDGNADKH